MMELILDQDFSLPVLATVAWVGVFYIFWSVQALANPNSFDPSARFDYSNNLWAIADRTALNMSEQNVIFLTALWLHTLFVDAEMSGQLGLYAAAFRLFYPFLRAVKFLLMELSTLPYYCIVYNMWINLVFKAYAGKALFDEINSLSMILRFLAVYLLTLIVAMGAKVVLSTLVSKTKTINDGPSTKED